MERTLRRARVALFASWICAALVGQAASAQEVVISIDELNHHILFLNPPIYDFTESQYSVDQGFESALEIEQDAQGRIRGRGHDTDGAFFDVRHVVKGSVHTKNGRTALRYKMTSAGSLTSGDPNEFKSVGIMEGTVEGPPGDAVFIGTMKLHTCLRVLGPNGRPQVQCSRNEVPQEADFGDAGDWEVDLSIVRSGNKVYGAGSITTAVLFPDRARTFDVDVSGRILKSGTAVIVLKSKNAQGLGSATITGQVGTDADGNLTLLTVQNVRGRILGQRFNQNY